ncbi:MAG TPA: divergent PAP2 family protein [Candidatus Nanoarchaeia archaeon]|nr:divergent PAP2 family protein [Candidatus Nanoarchaeia archaeon]
MLNNPYIVVPLVSWIVAQALKFAWAAAWGRLDFKYLYGSGGMPSAHSAVVVSLATTSLLLDGQGSHLFGLTAILAAIVMYDSFGVRRSSGEQAVALNRLIDSLGRDSRAQVPEQPLHEVLGHTPLEVAVGALLGFLLASLFNLDRVSRQITFLTAQPLRVEAIVYAVIFGLLLVGGIATRLYLRRRYPKSAAFQSFAKQLFWKTEVIAWPGLLGSFAQYENLPYFSWRVWPALLVTIMVCWDIYLYGRYRLALPQALAEEREAERKRRWFELGNKKKKRK